MPRRGNHKGGAIFRPKTKRYQGLVIPAAAEKFEAARAKLAALAGREPSEVSDGDTMEALARGWASAKREAEARKR